MTDKQIAQKVGMIVANGLSPCLRLVAGKFSFVFYVNTVRLCLVVAGCCDNQYWTRGMPHGSVYADASLGFRGAAGSNKAYRSCYMQLATLDSSKQVQMVLWLCTSLDVPWVH